MLPGRFRQAWEDLGEIDPLWAILSAPGHKFGRWDLAEFFETGESEIDSLMARAARLGHPRQQETALDFDCGVGRLTRALAGRFGRCVGVDISATMIARARELNAQHPGCEFLVNAVDDLRVFPGASFDLIYTKLVLMHLPRRPMIEAYVAEFIRTLRAGGLLVFQLPDRISPLYRLDPRRRLYSWLRALGIDGRF